MGFNDDMFRPPVILDIETAPHPCAADYLEPLDLSAIRAAGNLKDPLKIAADIEQRKAAATAEYEHKQSRASLDWNLSRIVALGWTTDGGQTIVVRTAADENGERTALEDFWKDAKGLLAGFCARTFDLPTIIQRSRLLGVKHRDVSLARYGKGSVIDLRDILTFDDARYEALMPRSLKMFCRRFGIPVEDQIDGSDIGRLVEAGDWQGVIDHVASDVRITAKLAERIGVIQPQTEAVL